MKKLNWSSILVIIFLLIIGGFIGNVIMAFYGNPITKMIASSKIRNYVEESYPDMDLEVSKAVYNFKFKEYGSKVQSRTSMDTAFYVHWNDGTISDNYKSEVLGHKKTYSRLQREFSDIVEATIIREFPYQTSILFAHFDKNMDNLSGLTLDMPLDTAAIPLSPTLVIYFYHDKINYEVFCERLLELRDILNENKIKIDYYSVVMEEPSEDGEKPKSSGEEIRLDEYPAERLSSDRLEEDIKEYLAAFGLEQEK